MDIQIAKWNDRYVDTKRDTTKHFAMILQELIHCPKKKNFQETGSIKILAKLLGL